jgi:hypothetical protein
METIGVFGAFHQVADGIGHPLLHFRVGALHGIDSMPGVECSGIGRRNSCSTHSDAIVVSAKRIILSPFFGFSFEA